MDFDNLFAKASKMLPMPSSSSKIELDITKAELESCKAIIAKYKGYFDALLAENSALQRKVATLEAKEQL